MNAPHVENLISPKTRTGRAFLIGSGVVALLSILELVAGLPASIDFARKILSLVWLAAVTVLGAIAVLGARRAFLWRVRRKLLLSYLFLGAVPLVLVLALVVTGGSLLYLSVTQYVFQDALSDLVEDVRQTAEVLAAETDGTSGEARAVVARRQAATANRYPELSIAVLDAGDTSQRIVSGPWSHDPAPNRLPRWVIERREFAGLLVLNDTEAVEDVHHLVVRAVSRSSDRRRHVIVDLPITAAIVDRIAARTGIRMATLAGRICGNGAWLVVTHGSASTLFSRSLASVSCTDWSSGREGPLEIDLDAPLGLVSDRLSAVSLPADARGAGQSWWDVFVQLAVLLAVLFFIIQGSALFMGVLLARSITSAVHELAVGTERVQQGDFTHRIPIASRDQLGDLAESFNRMSGSIDHLLHVQREKQRLDDELRIARDIQKSLLPVRVPDVPGLDIADLCEPAREVGGDYYDFFEVGPGKLGIIIADVSGKGTSAALYMAELKGLMLALSHTEPSPRRLLIDVNRRLSEHLDNRSFITMTYAIVDLGERTVSLSRAGHTPAVLVSGGTAELVAPDGMVLGLRLPGAGERFEQLLDEDLRPIADGDVLVLYTDGITEAMDAGGDLFGDAGLMRVVAASSESSAAEIRERIVAAVRAFAGDAEPHDDMTMIVVKVQGDGAQA